MKTLQTTKKLILLAVGLLLAGPTRTPAQPQSPEYREAPLVVGRVYDIEGDLLRYVPETRDWVAVVRDAPFAAEGTLYSGIAGRAELIVPNGTWVRVGNSTQLQFIGLESDLTEVDVASGEVRFGNKSRHAVIKATSDFGYVLADAGAIFDFSVGENSVEVIPLRGTVTFVHAATNARYDVAEGAVSLLADSRQVSSGEGAVDADWDRWNAAREDFWAVRAQSRPRSAQYLPPALHDESYVLDESGQWDNVVYEGQRRSFWRPSHVAAGWAPFTVGRWTDWGGDQTWIPAEPFGYMTHHYGNWVYVGHSWYWAPPVVSVRIGRPRLDIGFDWNPGRVSWIHTTDSVGWVPLAPRETYYSHRRWGGRHSEVIGRANLSVNVNIGSFAFLAQAIVVNQRHFSDVRDYTRVRETNINRTTIINNYRAAPVVNNTVINNYTVNNNRYNYTNVTVNEKPHSSVLARIDRNEKSIHGGKRERGSSVKSRMGAVPAGRINQDARIASPVIVNRIVQVSEVSRPQTEVKFKQREVKAKIDRKNQHAPPVREAQRMESPRIDLKNRLAAPARETKRMEQPRIDLKKQPAPSVAETRKVAPPKNDRKIQPAPLARETKKVEQPRNELKKQPAPHVAEIRKVEPPKNDRKIQPAPLARETKKVEQPRNELKKQPAPHVAEIRKVEPPKNDRKIQPAPLARETKRVEQPRNELKKQPAPHVAEIRKVEPPKNDRKIQPAPLARETKRVEQPRSDRKDRPAPPIAVTKKAEPNVRAKPAGKDAIQGGGAEPRAAASGAGKSSAKSDKEDNADKKNRGK